MKTIHFVGGNFGELGKGQVWGGSMATGYCIRAAFANSTDYRLVNKPRGAFDSVSEVRDFLSQSDIGWLDETSLLAEFFQAGLPRPDLVGPVARSPVKRYYSRDRSYWESPYSPEWFYSKTVLRLNEAEERSLIVLDKYKGVNWLDRVSFIRHCIDLHNIKPAPWGRRRLILWAGNRSRPAKNHDLWEEVQSEVERDGGVGDYELKTISNHTIDQYLDLLDETALLVNTSLYESFCNAVNEARAKGVPTLVKEKFNGDRMFLDQSIQVPYTAGGYANKIRELIEHNRLQEEGSLARKWAEENVHPDNMKRDIVAALHRL